jgi:glycerate kinase
LFDFEKHCEDADLVITGEGRLDTQTLSGKLPAVVATRAAPKPVVAVVGRNSLGERSSPFTGIFAASDFSFVETTHNSCATRQALESIGAEVGKRFSFVDVMRPSC